jgi:hypothetical protein
MIKDNHIAAVGGIEKAVEAARAAVGHTVKIEVEIDGLDQLQTITRLPDSLDASALGQISIGRFANRQVLSPNGGSMITLIQNDLDNQRIVDITTIDIGIKNLGIKSSELLRFARPDISIPAELRR